MLKIRFGATPVVDVKMPQPLAKVEQPDRPVSVIRSCHKPKIVLSYGPTFGGAGRQLVTYPPGSLSVTKSRRPFELALTVLYVWPYNVNGNGSATAVSQSSQWLPVSVVPATMLPALPAIV